MGLCPSVPLEKQLPTPVCHMYRRAHACLAGEACYRELCAGDTHLSCWSGHSGSPVSRHTGGWNLTAFLKLGMTMGFAVFSEIRDGTVFLPLETLRTEYVTCFSLPLGHRDWCHTAGSRTISLGSTEQSPQMPMRCRKSFRVLFKNPGLQGMTTRRLCCLSERMTWGRGGF